MKKIEVCISEEMYRKLEEYREQNYCTQGNVVDTALEKCPLLLPSVILGMA